MTLKMKTTVGKHFYNLEPWYFPLCCIFFLLFLLLNIHIIMQNKGWSKIVKTFLPEISEMFCKNPWENIDI